MCVSAGLEVGAASYIREEVVIWHGGRYKSQENGPKRSKGARERRKMRSCTKKIKGKERAKKNKRPKA